MCMAIVVGITGQAIAEQAKEIICTGKVVDEQGQPIAGARLALYQVMYDYAVNTAESQLSGEVTTTGDGIFSFKAVVERDITQNGYIVAEEEGLALGWAEWEMRDSQQQDIILGKPKELSGMVVDEDGKPVPGADVGIWLIAAGEGQDQQSLGRPVAEKLLTKATDASGRFTFTNIPAEATADFIIRKAGSATLRTYRSTGYANQKMTFAPGQAGIKLVLPAEARIQGTIVNHRGQRYGQSGRRYETNSKNSGEPAAFWAGTCCFKRRRHIQHQRSYRRQLSCAACSPGKRAG